MITIADILWGYGIDTETLQFKMTKDADLSPQQARWRLLNDPITVDGYDATDFFVCDMDGNKLDGQLEISTEYDDLANEAEGRCAQNDW